MSSESVPNEGTGKYNNPVASVEEATGLIEKMNDSGEYADIYSINLFPGTYEGFEIKDFSNESLVISGDEAVIKGSTTIDVSAFEKVTSESILAKIPEYARDNIYRTNLYDREFIDSLSDEFRIFTEDNICSIARYPNDDGVESSADFMKTGDVTEKGFKYTDSRAECWTEAPDAYVYGMFRYDYFNDNYKASVDTVNGVINVESGEDTISSDRPFYIYNLIEELDAENEYYFDRNTGYLYVYSEDITSADYEISCKDNLTVLLENCDSVTVSGLTVQNGYSDLIRMNNCRNSIVEDCILKNGALRAGYLSGCANVSFDGCTAHNLGGGGFYISGGDRITLSGGANSVKNCTIYDYQLLDREYTGAINLMGMNHVAQNNRIYNGYSMAINMYGNNSLIENNEIYDVCLETNDMGAIYSHGDWTFRGNVINHNYIHSLKAFELGVNAIYFDHAVSGTTITNNIFENVAKTGVYINGGRDNVVENNLFIKNNSISCEYGVMIGDILNWGGSFDDQNEVPQDLKDKLNDVNYQSEYYSVYDNVANILEDEPVLPKYNRVVGNVFVGMTTPIPSNWLKTVNMATEFESKLGGEIAANYISNQDPGFYDMSQKDYRLDENSEIFSINPDFKEITLENIGPTK